MVVFLLFYVLVIPICTLLHEIGHALGVLLTSKAHARVYMGTRSDENKENFAIGRLHFHIHWSYVGFVSWDGQLEKHQRAISLVGGPFMSLLLVILFVFLSLTVPQGDWRTLFIGTAILNLIQLIMTSIPITYPRWMGAYHGHPSDGLQLYQLLRKE